MHLLWATGRKHFEGVDAALSALEHPAWVHALPYLEDMPGALAASDIALSRAGAMTIAELLNEGLPSILVPLPTSAEDHQMYNARALEAAGAARVVPEAELTAARLATELQGATSGAERLASMRAAAQERARPEATSTIAHDVATFLPPLGRAA
jgi:UDP-N-acetylglucosamine--N-acetylmuramyl-(pentapeptide) pyrophosphoryl-undecaprenol N-acetylglucosamine transferase